MNFVGKLDKRFFSNVDWQLLVAMASLCVLGLGLQWSAGFSSQLGFSPPMQRQAISMGIGLLAFVFCMTVRTSFWHRLAFFFFILGCGLLLLILFKGVVAGGSRRWLDLGGVRMQPSEFMKVGVILALARVFGRENSPRDGYTLPTLVLPSMVLLIPVVLILKEPDLGTSLCYLLIGGSMILLAGVKKQTALRLSIAAVALSIPAWIFLLKDYQRQRVLTFLSPEQDPLGSGYHAIQSKIAVGSGAVTGKGFLEGTQTQLRFLPEQTTDFIFSVLAEEWGFVGSLSALLLYGWLVFRILKIASRCNDTFSAFVCFGVAALIFWHTMINIGMVIGVVPVVGLTLTFLSYGGSSVVTLMAALGIVAGVSGRRFLFA